MCVDVNVHFNCSHWIAGPSYQPESNEKRTLQEIFYKECCSNNWFRNTLCHYYYYEYYYCAGACISALSSTLLRWSDDFFYYYLQLSQFSLKPAVMVSGVIGSIPCGHSPATSGQTKTKTKTMTSDCKASGHKALISVNASSHMISVPSPFLNEDPFGIAYS